jgi:hypothetical protein
LDVNPALDHDAPTTAAEMAMWCSSCPTATIEVQFFRHGATLVLLLFFSPAYRDDRDDREDLEERCL